MRSADGDENASFADFQAAEAMHNSDEVNGEFLVQLGRDFSNFGEGHGFVGFVVEIESGEIVGLIADETVEGDDRAVFGSADFADESGHVDGPANQLADVVVR